MRLSNKKPHGMNKGSVWIHGANVIKQWLPAKPTSKKIIQLKTAQMKILKGAIILVPSFPKRRPKSPQTKLLNKGKKIIDKYMIKD